MGNNTYVDLHGIGDCKNFSKNSTIILKDVLFALTIKRNMIFVSVLDKKDFEIRLKSGFVMIRKDGLVILRGKIINDMYFIVEMAIKFESTY